MSSNEGLTKSELITKLEEISVLYTDATVIQAEMEGFVPDDHYERKIQVPKFPGKNPEWEEAVDHEATEAVQRMGKLYKQKYGPQCPVKPKIKEFEEPSSKEEDNKKSNLGCLSYVAAGGCIFFLLGVLLNLNDEYSSVPTMLVIAAVCAGLFVLLKMKTADTNRKIKKKREEAQKNYNREKEEILAQYQTKVEEYNKKLEALKVEQERFLKKYEEWRNIYLAHLKEEASIATKLETERVAAVKAIFEEKFIPATNKLSECNDLLAEEYLPAIAVLIELLRTNRADDLKDAINLYEELVYRERQLQLQREQEEQRRHEEELRRRDEERRHREEMKFREDQERQRRREEEQRRSDEERRYREDMRAREAEARSRELQERERIRKEQYREHMNQIEQQNKQRSAGQAQCRACANVGRCNMTIHNNAPTCTGFTPRR